MSRSLLGLWQVRTSAAASDCWELVQLVQPETALVVRDGELVGEAHSLLVLNTTFAGSGGRGHVVGTFRDVEHLEEYLGRYLEGVCTDVVWATEPATAA